MSVFKYHAFIFCMRPPRWLYGTWTKATVLFTVMFKNRGKIHRRELIVIKCLRSNDPGFLAGNFCFHEQFATGGKCAPPIRKKISWGALLLSWYIQLMFHYFPYILQCNSISCFCYNFQILLFYWFYYCYFIKTKYSTTHNVQPTNDRADVFIQIVWSRWSEIQDERSSLKMLDFPSVNTYTGNWDWGIF